MEKISKNCYKSTPVLSVENLALLAGLKEAVYHENWGIKPAIVIMNMPAFIIFKAIKGERLYTIINKSYEKTY